MQRLLEPAGRNQNSSEEKTNGTRHHGKNRGKRSNTTDNINGTHAIDGGHHINQNTTGNRHTREIHNNEHQQGSSANTTHENHENGAQHYSEHQSGTSSGLEKHRNLGDHHRNDEYDVNHKQRHERHQEFRSNGKYENEDRQHSGHQQGGSNRRDENNRKQVPLRHIGYPLLKLLLDNEKL